MIENRKMIRQGLMDLVAFGIADTWEEVSDGDNPKLGELIENIYSMRPLSNEEAMFLAHNLNRGDLEGAGHSLTYSIASAQFWPSQAQDILYINKYSDLLAELKKETMLAGNLRYHFTSEANNGLSFSENDASIMLLKVQKEISELDLQMLLGFFYSVDGIEPSLIDHLSPIIQSCIKLHNIDSSDFVVDSLILSTLIYEFGVEI